MPSQKPKHPPVVKRVKKKPLEKSSEQRLRKGVLKRGGQSYKFSSMQRKGVSDQIVLLYGLVVFVEMKREGITKLSRTQNIFKTQVCAQGLHFCTVSGHAGVDEFLAFMDANQGLLHRVKRWFDTFFKPINNRIFKG